MIVKLGDYQFEVDPRYYEEDWVAERSSEKVAGQLGVDHNVTGIQPIRIRFTGRLLATQLTDGDLKDIEDEFRNSTAIPFIDNYEECRPVRVTSLKTQRSVTRTIFTIELIENYSSGITTLSANFIVGWSSETLSGNFVLRRMITKDLSANFDCVQPL